MCNPFYDLIGNYKQISLPDGWCRVNGNDTVILYFVNIFKGNNKLAVIEKQLVFNIDETVKYYIFNHSVEL